jgi:undecaprenyl-diphosphatase
MKEAVERPRPSGGLVDVGGFAYPSGHAALGVSYLAIGIVLARVAPLSARVALGTSGLAMAVLVGLSRLYLRVHYLSDVVGGWATGLAAYSICGSIALVAAYLAHSFKSSPEDRERAAAERRDAPFAGDSELPADVPASRRASS